MARQGRPWIVTPHSPLVKLEDNLWLVSNTLPGTPLPRRMAIIKRSDGSLLFYQAIPLDGPTLAEVQAWGVPRYLVVPHANHGFDALPFAEKLGVRIYGPKRNEAKMRARFGEALTIEEIPADPAVQLESMRGTKTGEPVVLVHSGARVSAVFADALMAVPREGSPRLMRWIGFAGGPKVSPVFRLFFMSDRKALRGHLEQLAEIRGLTHLVPCRGSVISTDAAQTLKRVAATL